MNHDDLDADSLDLFQVISNRRCFRYPNRNEDNLKTVGDLVAYVGKQNN